MDDPMTIEQGSASPTEPGTPTIILPPLPPAITADSFDAVLRNFNYPILERFAYEWKIENVSKLSDKVESPVFEVAGIKFNVLFFPRGNNLQDSSVSIFLNCQTISDNEDAEVCAEFALTLRHPTLETVAIWKGISF